MMIKFYNWLKMKLFFTLFTYVVFFTLKTEQTQILHHSHTDKSQNNDLHQSENDKNHRIAIIGGGVGGTSSAYFLRELVDKANIKVDIDLYEKNDHLGGRLSLRNIDDKLYETGGSIIHERNKYAVDLVNDLGLEKRDLQQDDEKMCIYNGKTYPFCESRWKWVTALKIWYRYGLEAFRLKNEVNRIIDDFEKIYNLQKANVYFESVEDMLEAMSVKLANLTKTTFKNFLINSGHSKNFINELVQSITLVNYGQTVNIPAFVGAVSYAGAGSNLWSIHNGNVQLPLKLGKKSQANILLGTKVKSIVSKSENLFEINALKSDGTVITELYNNVIIAMPLTNNPISFENFTVELNDKFNLRKYHRTVSTLVSGDLGKKYKGRQILCDNQSLFFTSIGRIFPVDGTSTDKRVYKVFSKLPLTTEQLSTIFSDIRKVDITDWLAYPHYDSITLPLPRFVLSKGIYDVNAIEWAASAIEMSLIGGKNAALLVYNQLGGKAYNVYTDKITRRFINYDEL